MCWDDVIDQNMSACYFYVYKVQFRDQTSRKFVAKFGSCQVKLLASIALTGLKGCMIQRQLMVIRIEFAYVMWRSKYCTMAFLFIVRFALVFLTLWLWAGSARQKYSRNFSTVLPCRILVEWMTTQGILHFQSEMNQPQCFSICQ